MNNLEQVGESQYSLNLTSPIDENEDYISLHMFNSKANMTDEEIRFYATSLLRLHEDIVTDDIELLCDNGVVILEGHIPNSDMAGLCVRICELVPGVKEVVNQLSV